MQLGYAAVVCNFGKRADLNDLFCVNNAEMNISMLSSNKSMPALVLCKSEMNIRILSVRRAYSNLK